MKKTLLITALAISSGLFISALHAASVGFPDEPSSSKAVYGKIEAAQQEDKKIQSLSEIQEIVSFAGYAYSRYRTLENLERLRQEGWGIENILGATGGISGLIRPTESTMGLFAVKGKRVIIAFRGIESLADVITVHKFIKTSAKPIGGEGQVHQGFLQTLQSIKSNLDQKLTAISPSLKDMQVTFTGHGTGGSLAILASQMLAHHSNTQTRIFTENMCVITLGAPDVGDVEFSERYNLLLGKQCFNASFTWDLGVDVFKNLLRTYASNGGKPVPLSFSMLKGSLISYFKNWWNGQGNKPFDNRHYHLDGNFIGGMIEDYIHCAPSPLKHAK